MIRTISLFLLFILISNCSLDKKSRIWNEREKSREKSQKNLVIKELFVEENLLNKELNSNVKIKLNSNLLSNNISNNLSNNYGSLNYDGDLKVISKYNFSKIDNFNRFEPEIIFNNKNLFFFDNKGSILKFDASSKLIWKKNYYSRSEKKLKPILSMFNSGNYLIIADNLAKYYAVDIKSGDLLWMKNNIAPFNSQIKVHKNNIFVIDFQNILRCYSIINGEEIWNIKTDNSFVKSQKKLSLILSDSKVFFNNTLGDISAVDIKNGNLIWQTPTQDSSIFESSFQLKTSDLISVKDSILFSNNKNEFYSIDVKSGTIIWKQKISSIVRPVVSDNLVFTVSENGYLIIIENKSGNIIRITNIFDKIKQKKRINLKPVGFIIGKNNIYLTTNKGHLIVVSILTGRSNLLLKLGSNKLSRPFISDKNLFIIKNNAVIKMN